ncbi:RNI-like protein [Mitosporidium daphniae]|uniref:RNI-like protein n=1 Tax=Mitosporidium daphniae TaxID=1485682 RepID=A0A098VSK6_9MICR|nr:RNI-like protein [Mitosporidium daphniae]KGG50716.1 RNI-like protein [Mitosporidium daphniae]|eukprot:XP_013237159.1 RNI-like protein [Mitosporidium daphniae]
MQHINASGLTPVGGNGSEKPLKSSSAPSVLSSEENVFTRPVLRSISNMSVLDMKAMPGSIRQSKDKSGIRYLSSDSSKRKGKSTLMLHPIDNVVMPTKLDCKSPQTPLSKYLSKRVTSINRSPLSDTYLNLHNESLHGDLDKKLFGAACLQKQLASLSSNALDLSNSFGTKYERSDLPILPTCCPSSSDIDSLFSLLGSKSSLIQNLTELNLSNVHFSVRNVAMLNSLTHLTNLNLTNTNLTDKHLEALSNMSNGFLASISRLNFDGNLLISDSSFQSIKKFPNLTELNLDNTSITFEGLLGYAKSMCNTLRSFKTLKFPSKISSEIIARKASLIGISSYYGDLDPQNILLLDQSSIDQVEDKSILLHQLRLLSTTESKALYSNLMSVSELQAIIKNRLEDFWLQLLLIKLEN